MTTQFEMTHHLVVPVVLMITTLSVYTDCRWRKIWNVVTFPGIGIGILLHLLGNSWSGLVFSIVGLLAGAGLMLIPFVYGQMGAGDVKLMGALGSLLGGYEILNVFLYTTIAGGFLALGFAFYHKDIIPTFKKVWLLVKCLIFFRSPAAGMALFEKSVPIPYGLAIGLGVITFLLFGRVV